MTQPPDAAADIKRLDEDTLERYLAQHIAGFKGPLKAEKFPGGASNPTFLITAGGKRYTLRRKPPGKLLKSAHAVDREYKVMKALDGTDVPVPRMLHLCQDDSVIGSMFFVMEYLEGRIFWDPVLPDLAKDERTKIYDEMNRVLAALHTVDVAKVGLADFGRPGSYFLRQTSRWTDQYRASQTVKNPDIEALIDWLANNTPPDDGRVSIVHGDYRLDNMIFSATGPRVLGVIDWEISTLGHPFSDIAYQCMQWRLPNEGALRGLGTLDRRAHGIPTEEEYVARYCERTGIDGIPIWTYCLVFNMFRLAAIIQGVYKRGLDGNASDPVRAKKMGEAVPVLGRLAVGLLESSK